MLPLQDTDLEGHLRHAHEQTIISVIEEGRRATIDQFYASLESSMRRDWEKQKELVFEELGRHAASSNSTDNTLSSSRSASSRKGFAGKDTFDFVSIPKNGSQMRPKQVKYSTAVRRMNDYRKQGSPVGVVDILASAGTAGQVDAVSGSYKQMWLAD
ncbi:nuclear pore complex subunit [Cystobasidiomycetes sp. EMM_F5]